MGNRRKGSKRENMTHPHTHNSTSPVKLCRVKANNKKLAALGLPVPGDKEAKQKRKAEAARASREAKKYQKTVSNWDALCRVGCHVKVPGGAPGMPSDIPEVRPCHTPPVSL